MEGFPSLIFIFSELINGVSSQRTTTKPSILVKLACCKSATERPRRTFHFTINVINTNSILMCVHYCND